MGTATGLDEEEAVNNQVDETGMSTRNAIFDWGNAVFLALGTGILVSVVFGAAVLLLSGEAVG